MRRGASPHMVRRAQIGGNILFVIVLTTWTSLLFGSVILVCQGQYGGAIALALVCNAMANLGQYSEAWNRRVSHQPNGRILADLSDDD